MTQAASSTSRRRIAFRGLATIVIAVGLVGCGSSTPATSSPSQAASVAPSVAPPSAPAATPSPSPTATTHAPSTAPSGGLAGGDAAEGLKIGAPYTLTPLPTALQQAMEAQMASGLGAFGPAIQVGFRQVDGGGGTSILMVVGFPTGSLSAAAYQAAVAGMGSSMGATFETTTVDGVQVSNGKAATGGVAVFHVGDHMLVVISPTAADTLPVATALIKANS